MANTYTKIYLHLIFAVKGRVSLISPLFQGRIYDYMCKVVISMGHDIVALGGIENHVHLLIRYNPAQQLSELVRELKVSTTKMINTNKLSMGKFGWQRGYGCFSHSPSQVCGVTKYINNQYDKRQDNTQNHIGIAYSKNASEQIIVYVGIYSRCH